MPFPRTVTLVVALLATSLLTGCSDPEPISEATATPARASLDAPGADPVDGRVAAVNKR